MGKVDPRAIEISRGIADQFRDPRDGSGTGEAIYRLIEALETPRLEGTQITRRQFFDAVLAATKNTVEYANGTSTIIPSEEGVLLTGLQALGITVLDDDEPLEDRLTREDQEFRAAISTAEEESKKQKAHSLTQCLREKIPHNPVEPA